MSLSDYLSKNYLTADGGDADHKKSKKRKRRDGKEGSGLRIADDGDTNGFGGQSGSRDDGDVPIIAGKSSEFRKAKKSNWQTIGDAPTDDSAAAADAILAKDAAEQAKQLEGAEDGPLVVDENGDSTERMTSGARAGLQSAADVAADQERKRKAERKRFEADPAAAGAGAETVYRDATGRIINVAMKRAEARRQAELEAAKKKAQDEAMMGEVQRAERDERRAALRDAKYMPLARTADDAELNAEQRAAERWNDPAAAFLEVRKQTKDRHTGRPLYTGGFAPNRYGIRPGHRWDGVDRGNGFEKELLMKRNEQAGRRDLEYAWEMDE